MFEDLLDLFERDRQSTTQSKTGWRGRLSSLLGDDDREARSSSERERKRDDEDDDRSSGRSHRRERELFEFGD